MGRNCKRIYAGKEDINSKWVESVKGYIICKGEYNFKMGRNCKSTLYVKEDINLKWVETVKEYIICERAYYL